jgi:hypothetical protein
MSEWLRMTLFIGAAGVAVTLAAVAASWWYNEPRRLARTFRQGLGAPPDAAVIAPGTGRGIALSLATRRLVTAWDRGGWRMVYPLSDVIGAEVDLDGEVAARVLRGEAGRRLDRSSGAVEDVRLRLIFDDPLHPDFELALWPTHAKRGGFGRPRDAIAEGNRWIARIEAMLRRSSAPAAGAASVRRPRPSLSETLDEVEDDEDDILTD